MCKYMGWSYADLMGVPVDVFDEVLKLIADEQKRTEEQT